MMATAPMIQPAKDLPISNTELPSATSSPTSLPSNSTESMSFAERRPRKKKPFKPSKRQQMRAKATEAPAEPVCSLSHPSVYVPDRQDYKFNPNAWSDLSSEVWMSDRAKELKLQWDEEAGEEQLVKIAQRAVRETEAWFSDDDESGDDNARVFRMLNLVSSMRFFVKHCRSHLKNVRSFKLKLAALHGKCATRCPLWHADNVPLRWIQTYTGPGCYFLDEGKQQHGFRAGFNPFLQRVREADHDRESRELGSEWKKTLVEMSGVPMSQSPVGEPAILVGRRWYVWSIDRERSEEESHKGPMAGVLHRSPHNVPADQGRILLNLDVVCTDPDEHHHRDHHHDHSKCGGSCGQRPKVPASTTTRKPTNSAPKKKIHTPLADGWIQRRKDKKSGNVKAGGRKCSCGPKTKCPC